MDKKGCQGLLPEWTPQAGVLLVWPHSHSDWAPLLAQAHAQYIELILAIAKFEPVFVICPEELEEHPPRGCFAGSHYPVSFIPIPTNDTWIRDYGPLCKASSRGKQLVQYTYNGWGQKYPSYLDNQVTYRLLHKDFFKPEVTPSRQDRRFALEGGGVESNGVGILLVNRYWLEASNRNEGYTQDELKEAIRDSLEVKKIIEVDCPPLEGDDTDGHIDTIVRFVSSNCLAYVAPSDPLSPNYKSLILLEKQVKALKNLEEEPFELLPLPDVGALENEHGELLPATYANFLFVNGGIIIPTYGKKTLDEQVLALFRQAFPSYKIFPVEATTLIQWHGSIHCATMQIAKDFL